jgi:hypothetical protein
MSENQDERLAAMLYYRWIEGASPNLVERIILKAQNVPQTQKIPLLERGAPNPSQRNLSHREK